MLKSILEKESIKFHDLITDVEFSALINRIDSLLSTQRFPTPSDEWPAVPWPPF
jgi:hypothetical protein